MPFGLRDCTNPVKSESARKFRETKDVTLRIDDAFCGFDVSFGMLRLHRATSNTVIPPFHFIKREFQLGGCAFTEQSQYLIFGNHVVHAVLQAHANKESNLYDLAVSGF